MIPRLNIEQERAKAAYRYAERSNKKGSNYDGNVKKVPMYILTNGFANFVAFAKSKKEWEQVYLDIEDWLKTETQGLVSSKFSSPSKSLIDVVINDLDDKELRLVTKEVLALFNWLRRFVKQDA